MKQYIVELLEEYYAEIEPEMEEEPVAEYEEMPTEEEEAELNRFMEGLVMDWLLNGNEIAGSMWSDLWKDKYGTRPRYTREQVLVLYGLEDRE